MNQPPLFFASTLKRFAILFSRCVGVSDETVVYLPSLSRAIVPRSANAALVVIPKTFRSVEGS